MFDAESLAFLRDNLQEVVVNPTAEPDGVYLVREADGDYKTVQAFPPHRRYRALSIGGLVSMGMPGFSGFIAEFPIYVAAPGG